MNQDTFVNYHKLFKIALILPISSASCERSFSAMRRIKNWLRSTMTHNRFINLSILNIEKKYNVLSRKYASFLFFIDINSINKKKCSLEKYKCRFLFG